MQVAVTPPKSSRIRAFAQANPTLDPKALAKVLGVAASEVRNALGTNPKLRTKSVVR